MNDEIGGPGRGTRWSRQSTRQHRSNPRNRVQPRRGAPGLLYALPAMLLVGAGFFIPFLANGVFAFLNWTGYRRRIDWAGLNNFDVLSKLGVFEHTIIITAIFSLIVTVTQNVVALGIALAIRGDRRGNSAYRTVFFIPVLISPLAAGYIWSAILAPHGPLNRAITAVIPGTFGYAWLGHPYSALICVAFIEAWKWNGITMLVFISGLNAIPREYHDAAAVDGAGTWQLFRGITAPLLRPSFAFNLAVSLAGAINTFDVVLATTHGGPGDATVVLNVALYEQFVQGYFGNASALGLVITVLILLAALPMVMWLNRQAVDR